MNKFVILFFPILLNLKGLFPSYDSLYDLTNAFVFSFFWLVVFYNFITIRKIRISLKKYFDKSIFYLFFVFIAMVTIGNFRAFFYGTLNFSELLSANFRFYTLIIMFLVIFLKEKISHKEQYILKGIFHSLNFYIFLALILWLMGFRISDPLSLERHNAVCSMLRFIGIENITRAHFPIAPDANAFGMVCGINLVVNLIVFFNSRPQKKDKILATFGILSSFVIILLVDSRATLFYALISALLIIFIRSKDTIKIPYIAFVVPFSFFLMRALFDFIPDEIKDAMVRLKYAEFGYSRLYIWGKVQFFLRDFNYIHLVGYGRLGQVTSGCATFYFSEIFEGTADTIRSSNVHNFVLQQILDYGYIGMLFSVLFIFNLIKKYSVLFLSSQNPFYLTYVGILLFLCLLSFSEAVPTAVFPTLYTFFLYVCCLGTFLERKHKKTFDIFPYKIRRP